MQITKRPDLIPSLGAALCGALWGLFWLPLRAFENFGFEGSWPGLVIYLACLIVLVPVIPFRWRQIRANARAMFITGLFTGTAFAFYATSLLLTEVVRTILLFYLSPVWATLLGVLFLGERLTWRRMLALLFGMAGLLVVLGLGEGMPWPRNLGDWLALAAGLSWAYGTVKLYQNEAVATFEQILVFVVGGTAILLVAVSFGGPQFGMAPALEEWQAAAPFIGLTVLYTLPMLFLTIWPAKLLSPGRVGILLMGEVGVGVASAAFLAGEPFGLRELLGTLLILSAAAIEVSGHINSKASLKTST